MYKTVKTLDEVKKLDRSNATRNTINNLSSDLTIYL